MDTQPHPFDVCMVCALSEEARALLDVIAPYCDGSIEEHTSFRSQYSYRTATITNKHGERSLCISPGCPATGHKR